MRIQQIDDNHRTITSNESAFAEVTVVFDGGTADGIGDEDGANNPYTLFTVTGDVLVSVFGVCHDDLAGASATIEVGVAGDTAFFIDTVTATDVAAGYGLQLATSPAGQIFLNPDPVLMSGEDIILTVGTADVTAGEITFYCLWRPLSDGAQVVANDVI